MSSYPASKRKGQTEALEYEERERLFDRGLDRPRMNSLMQRLQDRLGSKNKLAEAIYERKLAASNIKKVVEGTTRYTDTVIDKVLLLADRLGVPRIEAEPVAANDDPAPSAVPRELSVLMQSDLDVLVQNEFEEVGGSAEDEPPVSPNADVADDRPTTEEAGATDDQPATESAEAPVAHDEGAAPDHAPVDDEHSSPTAEDADGEHREQGESPVDWLSGVRDRRADFARLAAEHDEEIADRVARVAALETEIREITERRAAAMSAIGEIDNALAILQTI